MAQDYLASKRTNQVRPSCCVCCSQVYHCSVTKSYLTLGNPVNCSTPGFLILHHHPEFAQTHVH